MRKLFLVLIMICAAALGGCGDVDWFPEQGVAQFSFSPDTVTDVAPGELVESNTITVSTRNASEIISVSGGEYSIGGGAFTSASGTVEDGDQVTVRHQASETPGVTVTTTLRIGDKSATFKSVSSVPVLFDEPLKVNVAPATDQTSSQETVELGSGSAPISVTGGSYSIGNGPFVTTAGTINDGETVRVRHQSAAAGTTGAAATKVTELTIGRNTSTFATSVTGVATLSVPVTGAPGAVLFAEGMSLVSGTQTVSVQEGFGLFSLDGETFHDNTEPQTVSLRPGQPIFFSNAQSASDTTTFTVGDRQVILLEVTRTAP